MPCGTRKARRVRARAMRKATSPLMMRKRADELMGAEVTVSYKDGQIFRGRIVWRHHGTIGLRDKNDNEHYLDSSDIKRIRAKVAQPKAKAPPYDKPHKRKKKPIV